MEHAATEKTELNLKDYVFFNDISKYGQVHIPKKMLKNLEIDREGAYAMIVIIPIVMKNSSMSKEEAHEFLKTLTSQSSVEDISQS